MYTKRVNAEGETFTNLFRGLSEAKTPLMVLVELLREVEKIVLNSRAPKDKG
jgi:hypothetical protein